MHIGGGEMITVEKQVGRQVEEISARKGGIDMTTATEKRIEVLEEAQEIIESKDTKVPVFEVDEELRTKLSYPVWGTTCQAR